MKLNRNFLRKFIFTQAFKNVFSFTFIFCLLSESVYPSVNAFDNSQNIMVASGSEPVAEIGSDMVDHFSGDFGYTVPLLNVPGPNGENVDLTASYAAGITMDQRSGWLGLGWGLNVGEISRQVVGAPDDYAGQPIITNSGSTQNQNFVTSNVSSNPKFTHNFTYGPFYYNKIKSNVTCPYSNTFATANNLHPNKFSTDNLLIEGAINNVASLGNTYSSFASGLYNNQPASTFFPSYFTKTTAPYAMPAYDNYFVSGPGIGGKIHPYIFSKYAGSAIDHPMLYSGDVQPGTIIQNRKTQFYFENSSFNNRSTFPDDMTNNRIRSGTYVKYYTNAEINTDANLFNYSGTSYTGFLDYRIASSTRRPTSQYDANAIGGIEVTNANGLTYHYSLPIMTNLNVDKSFYDNTFNLTLKKDYVISWKLTAITGADYKDMNENYMADEGDMGYWVQYKYGLWDDNFFDANVLYNLKTQTSNKGETYYLNKKNFTLSSNLNQATGAQYYLDFIRTSTHTAYFIKGIKLDDHSAEFAIGGTKVNPSLKLNRIILLRNQDKKLIENSAAWSTITLNSKFKTDLMSSPKDPSLIHLNKYTSNKYNIDNASLKSIEFVQDYSLCKKYFSNVNNSFGTVTFNSISYALGLGAGPYISTTVADCQKMNFGTNILYASVNPANFSTTDANNSGKLALNEIRSFEDRGLAVFSPYKFDYRKNNTIKNPNYNPLKQDIWGYYKSDRNETSQTNSGYVTMLSALNVDAWSLTKITLPQGGTIEVEYESDKYRREGFKDAFNYNYIIGTINHDFMRGPHLLFPINTISCGSPCSGVPSSETYEFDDRNHVDSCLRAQYGYSYLTPWPANDNGTCLWVVPTLVSCSKFIGQPFGSANSSVADFPDYWIYGSNVNPPTASIPPPPYYRYPNIEYDYCDGASHLGFAGYDKTKAYGYNMLAAKEMYGGGIRVKKIKVNETSENLSYEQNIEYSDGYCPVVPKKCMLGPADVNTLFALWQGNYNLLPYLNLTNVGYSEVKVKNTNKFSENNGFTKYTFENENFTANPLKIIPNRPGDQTTWPTTSPCDNSAIGTLTSAQKKWNIVYHLNAKLSDAENEKRGKLSKIQKFDNNSTPKEVYNKKFTYNYYSILENYSHNLSLDYNKSVAKNVTLTYAGSPPYNQLVTCFDNETYFHHMSYENCGVFLEQTEEKIDGISTKTKLIYDANTALVSQEIKTTNNVGAIITKTEYAYETSSINAGLLKSKIDDDKNLNQLTVPYKISTYKLRNDNVSDAYLVGQVKNQAFANPNQIREFSNISTTNNPNGTYCTNTSSAYKNNSLIAFESYNGLVNTTTTGANANAPSYRLQGKPTLFSVNGKVLESFGVNNRYSAVRLGYNNLYPLTSISNARYGSFGFTSFEDTITVASGVLHFGGEFTKGSTRYAAQATIKPHTGAYMSKVNPSTTGPSLTCRLFDPGKTYEAKVWVHKSSPVNARLAINIKGVSTTSSPINNTVDVYKNNAANIQVGDWILMKCQITIPSNLDYTAATYLVPPDLTVFIDNGASSGIAYFDDLMFSPVDIPISGNVFDMRTSRLIAVLDGENFATFLNYDAAGRPTSVYKETKDYGIKKISETEYNSCQNAQNLIQAPAPPISSPN